MQQPWRELSDAERQVAYSPSSCVGGDYQPFIAAYHEQSAAALQQGHWQRLSYGTSKDQHTLFCQAPTKNAALLIFIHGGYWQALSAESGCFPAVGCLAHGHSFASINYPLAPEASLAEIVDSCELAVRQLLDQHQTLGFDPQRVVLSGSSAGAHLAAMLALRLNKQIKATVLVSGIYDLEPLIGTDINDAVKLDTTTAQAMSPLRLAPLVTPSLLVVGDIETTEFKRQSASYASHCQQAAPLIIPHRNHFDVILDLAVDSTLLGQHTLALLS
jgi:arylformamidase